MHGAGIQPELRQDFALATLVVGQEHLPEVVLPAQPHAIERRHRPIDGKLPILRGGIGEFPDVEFLETLVGQIPLGRIEEMRSGNLVEQIETFLLGAADRLREELFRHGPDRQQMHHRGPQCLELQGFLVPGQRLRGRGSRRLGDRAQRRDRGTGRRGAWGRMLQPIRRMAFISSLDIGRPHLDRGRQALGVGDEMDPSEVRAPPRSGTNRIRSDLLLRQLLLLMRVQSALQHGQGGIGFGHLLLRLLHGQFVAQAPRHDQLIIGAGGTAVQLPMRDVRRRQQLIGFVATMQCLWTEGIVSRAWIHSIGVRDLPRLAQKRCGFSWYC